MLATLDVAAVLVTSLLNSVEFFFDERSGHRITITVQLNGEVGTSQLSFGSGIEMKILMKTNSLIKK